MDPRASKLVRKGLSAWEAETLVEAGFDKPSKIRKASNEDLEAVPGIGEVKRQELKDKFGKKGK